MASGKFNYLSKKWLDHLYGNTAYSAPATIYFGLSTAAFDNTKTGATIAEASYTGYARVAVTNNTTNFPNATGSGAGTKTGSNAGAITFPQNAGAAQTMLSAFTVDGGTLGAGNLLNGGDITSTQIDTNDTPSIPTNGFTDVST